MENEKDQNVLDYLNRMLYDYFKKTNAKAAEAFANETKTDMDTKHVRRDLADKYKSYEEWESRTYSGCGSEHDSETKRGNVTSTPAVKVCKDKKTPATSDSEDDSEDSEIAAKKTKSPKTTPTAKKSGLFKRKLSEPDASGSDSDDEMEKTAQALAEKLQKKLDGQSAELAQLRRKSQNSQSEMDELTMQLSAAKSDLDRANKRAEESLLQKHQKENEIQSLRKEFDMAKRVHQQELKISECSQEFEKKIMDEVSRSKALNDKLNAQLRRTEKDLSLARDELRKAEAQFASQRGLADATITEVFKRIQTYRSLSEVEENRLNITPSPVRGDKKKRSRSQVGSVSNISPKKSKPSEEQAVQHKTNESSTETSSDQSDTQETAKQPKAASQPKLVAAPTLNKIHF